MTGDPLALFRRGQQPGASGGNPTGLKTYEAFKTRDRAPERLEIRRVSGETQAPGYRYLMNLRYNGDFGTELILVYSFLIVKIRGKNMQPLIRSIAEGTCAFIQEFHPQEFAPPLPNEAMIETIEMLAGREGEE